MTRRESLPGFSALLVGDYLKAGIKLQGKRGRMQPGEIRLAAFRRWVKRTRINWKLLNSQRPPENYSREIF
jgi:hypothetical protein